jgi:hypothetical protein
MKLSKVAAVLLVSVSAACAGESPVAPSSRAAIPRFDGGVMYGSGNRIEADSTTSVQTHDAAPMVEAASAPGGVMYGSGN